MKNSELSQSTVLLNSYHKYCSIKLVRFKPVVTPHGKNYFFVTPSFLSRPFTMPLASYSFLNLRLSSLVKEKLTNF